MRNSLFASISLLGLIFFLLSCATTTKPIKPRLPANQSKSPMNLCERLERIEIHAHRGAWDLPENQLSAFLRAFDLGADKIELDIQVSGDPDPRNKLVVAHDVYFREGSCLDRDRLPLTKKVFFHDLTLSQIKSYDCGSIVKVGRAVPGETTSTLLEVLAAINPLLTMRGRPAGINIEIKYNDKLARYYPSREAYAQLLLDTLEKSEFDPARLMIQSFDIKFLKILRAKNSRLTISPLLLDMKDAREIAKSLDAEIVTPDWVKVDAQFINHMHEYSLDQKPVRVIPWTVNSGDMMLQLVNWGVDGLITDRPDIFMDLKKNCAAAPL